MAFSASPSLNMKLAPSDIYYSQDSISNTFGKKTKHAGKRIGEVLDDILEGRCSINDIDTINIVIRDEGIYRYISADNRRLWIFKKLEELDEYTEIPVKIVNSISAEKCNFGATIKVRGNPGGSKWRTWEKEMTRLHIRLFDANSLLPSEMSYSENKIKCRMSELQRDITNICEGQFSFTDIKMKVYLYGKKYCALDNEMLWKLRVAEKFQKCSEIRIEVVEIPKRKHIYYSGELYIESENSLFLGQFWKNIKKLPTLRKERVNAFEILPTMAVISDHYHGQSIVKALVESKKNREEEGLPVVKRGREFFTLDNRKLWIHQKISKIEEQRSEIAVNVKMEMDSNMLRYFTRNYRPHIRTILVIQRKKSYSDLEEAFLDFLQLTMTMMHDNQQNVWFIGFT